jgi:hypothetical protein
MALWRSIVGLPWKRVRDRLRAGTLGWSLPVLIVVLAAFFALGLPGNAAAATHIGTTSYSSSTTWTLAGSPYILDGNVTVQSGATLTIEPGVVVKFNGSARTLSILSGGSLQASGTTSARVTFTSLQDDSIGGDSGGDGPTTGSPGQWSAIFISGTATLDYADVRYGGFASGGASNDYLYGAVEPNQNSLVTIRNSTVTDNQHSGVKSPPARRPRSTTASLPETHAAST